MIEGELKPKRKTWDVKRKDLAAFVSACLTGEMAECSLGDIIEVGNTLTTEQEIETFIRSYDEMLKSQNKDFADHNMAYFIDNCIDDAFAYTWNQVYEQYFGKAVEDSINEMLGEIV